MSGSFKATLQQFYTGTGQHAVWFRYGLIAFDAVTIAFFILTAPLVHGPVLTCLGFGVGLIILAGFCAGSGSPRTGPICCARSTRLPT